MLSIFPVGDRGKLLGTKCVFIHQYLQIFGIKLNNYENFHSLEVVDRGSETQMGESLNCLISCCKVSVYKDWTYCLVIL